MKALLTTLLITVSFGDGCLGQGPIQGAFGMKLGDPFEPGDLPNEWDLDKPSDNQPPSEFLRYRFKPTSPFQGLTDYFVDVTPTSKRIYGIVASGAVPDEAEARRRVALLDIVLGEKYAADPPPEQSRVRRPVRTMGLVLEGKAIEQRELRRMVQASASRNPAPPAPQQPNVEQRVSPIQVTVFYVDYRLASQAAEELEAKKNAIEEAEQAEKAAKEKRQAEEWARKRAQEEEDRLNELPRLREEAKKLDTSGL